MNDMSGRFVHGTPIHFSPETICSHLSSPRAFAEAAARVEDALAQLLAAEHALERQLGDLSAYIKSSTSATSN